MSLFYKPCPFCGHAVDGYPCSPTFGRNEDGTHYIWCRQCGARGGSHEYGMTALGLWNGRVACRYVGTDTWETRPEPNEEPERAMRRNRVGRLWDTFIFDPPGAGTVTGPSRGGASPRG